VNLDALVSAALDEDIGPGDLTTIHTVGPDRTGRAQIFAKQRLVVCGHDVAARVFAQVAERLGDEVAYRAAAPEGKEVEDQSVIAEVEGALRTILIGERVALNWLMRLSGIATHTATFARAADGSGMRVVDTRKTTALHRTLEKHAVRCGGGHNHRMGLFDGVMIKDNHIAAVGDLASAVRKVRNEVHHLVKIEVEVTRLDQIRVAVEAGADVLLLDNMDNVALAEAVELARSLKPSVVLEASGNMTAERIRSLHGIDLDVVSAGGLIHQARWVDLSLKIR